MVEGLFKVKITVLKNMEVPDLVEKYGKDVQPICAVAKVGDKWIVERLRKPDDFCPWAWADIHRDVTHLALGGNFPWIKQKGTMISCCTDGLRPVIFKLERIEE